MKKRTVIALACSLMLLAGCSGGEVSETSVSVTTETSTVSSSETKPSVTPEPTEVPYVYMSYEGSEEAQAILETMTLEEKVYQMFMVSPEQLTGTDPYEYDTVFDDNALSSIEAHPVAGVILFGGNIVDPQQLEAFITSYQEASSIGLFIAVDEEGGDITRIASNPAFEVEEFSPMRFIEGEDEAYHVGNTIGTYLGVYGFNVDFAPVSDVDSNPDNTVIGDRAFSDDPYVTASMVSECVRGFHDSGMMCTLKHFPGHGDTVADTHFETASIDRSMDEIRACELIPFEAGIGEGADFIMAAHITTPMADATGLPASLSHYWLTDILRYEMGYEGIIITDSMIMQAITDEFSPSDAAVAAVYAGNDIILMPEDLETAAQGIIAAVESGEIPVERIDSSVLRILDKKIEYGLI